jgi:hypothetical protein
MVSYHAGDGKGPVRVAPPPFVAPAVSSLPTNIATRSAPINLDPSPPSERDPHRPEHSDGADQANGTDRDLGIVNDGLLPGGRLPR